MQPVAQPFVPRTTAADTWQPLPPPPTALQIMDGTPLRYGLPPMSVTKAQFEQKGDAFVERRANKARAVRARRGLARKG